MLAAVLCTAIDGDETSTKQHDCHTLMPIQAAAAEQEAADLLTVEKAIRNKISETDGLKQAVRGAEGHALLRMCLQAKECDPKTKGASTPVQPKGKACFQTRRNQVIGWALRVKSLSSP